MNYLISEIEADDEFYRASETHTGEYRVVSMENAYELIYDLERHEKHGGKF
jgi:hypothetical protein